MSDDAPDFTPYLNVRSASGPSWSPDGGALAFLSDISGVSEAWRVRCSVWTRSNQPGPIS